MATSRTFNFVMLLTIGLIILSQLTIQPAQAGIVLVIDNNVSHPAPTTANVRIFMIECYKWSYLWSIDLTDATQGYFCLINLPYT